MITVSINKEMMELYLVCFKNIFCHIDFWSRDLNFAVFLNFNVRNKILCHGFPCLFYKVFSFGFKAPNILFS